MARRPTNRAVKSLLGTIDEALALLGDLPVAGTGVVPVQESGGSLLDQCLALCDEGEARGPEPVRTLHHFACTGGSLFAKCASAMPNVRLLSEVDPLSTTQQTFREGRLRFSPTDMINLVQQGDRGADDALVLDMFLADLALIHADGERRGLRVLLRDHAHGPYATGPATPDRPGLRDIVSRRFPVLSLVTVRHPLDSYLSLRANGWVHFKPGTLDEYGARYLDFLDAHAGVPVLRYEDLLAEPVRVVRQLCGYLDLPYNPEFENLFDAVRVTGDSGRAGPVLSPRPRREVTDDLRDESGASPNYTRLLQVLGYGD